MKWIKIDKTQEMPEEKPFLISDEFGVISVGETAFDYYDAEYWFPIPLYPFPDKIITNDECILNLMKLVENENR